MGSNLLVLYPPAGPTGPISGCFPLFISTSSLTGPAVPAAPPSCPVTATASAAGMVFSLLRSRLDSCMTSYFSRFSLSSPCPLTVLLDGLSVLETQLAIPASGGSRHMFAYIAATKVLCACSRTVVLRILPSLKLSSSWFRLPIRNWVKLVL